jgi:CRP-like cAMP-binding protein
MSTVANSQLIQESVLGEDLSAKQCEQLSDIVKHKELEADEVLFEPGTKDGNLYILIDGKLDIFRDTGGTSKSIHIATVKKGNMIGELSFIDDEAHSMRLIARKKSSVIYLSKDDFEAKLNEQPRLVYDVMRSIMRYSHRLQHKIMEDSLEMQKMMHNGYM